MRFLHPQLMVVRYCRNSHLPSSETLTEYNWTLRTETDHQRGWVMEEMKEEYILFDELLQKTKSLREHIDQNEKMMFEIIRMDINSDRKVHWLEVVGKEINRVTLYIERLSNERKSFLKMKV